MRPCRQPQAEQQRGIAIVGKCAMNCSRFFVTFCLIFVHAPLMLIECDAVLEPDRRSGRLQFGRFFEGQRLHSTPFSGESLETIACFATCLFR